MLSQFAFPFAACILSRTHHTRERLLCLSKTIASVGDVRSM
ncbi:hypothetical protein OHAE_2913 [Ochrobactrum soli]|uniref:Uncharacterized protein n=1 Tax=Ochrobactrum soli TaxID=2448455 RepID=A0A2P9HFW3_9HYPH|nr:hypothetical protein OHAE_2913 [[Ochrobactrum] soli]